MVKIKEIPKGAVRVCCPSCKARGFNIHGNDKSGIHLYFECQSCFGVWRAPIYNKKLKSKLDNE